MDQLLYTAVQICHVDGDAALVTFAEMDVGAAILEGAAAGIQPAAAPGVQHIDSAATFRLLAAGEEDKAVSFVGVDRALLSPGCCSGAWLHIWLCVTTAMHLLLACGFRWAPLHRSAAAWRCE
jgi:hypothetical protein